MMEREPKSGPPSAISGKRAEVQKIRFLWKTDKNGVWSFPEPNVDPVIQRFESLLSGTNLVGSSGDAILDSQGALKLLLGDVLASAAGPPESEDSQWLELESFVRHSDY
jgi:hypothetical protein